MSKISPEYILKHSGEAITDLDFWNIESGQFLLASYGGNAGVDMWDVKSRRPKINVASDCLILSSCGLKTGEIVTLSKEGHLNLVDLKNGSARNIIQLVIPEVAFCKAAVLPQRDEMSNVIVAVPGEAKSSVNVWNLRRSKIMTRLIPPSDIKLGMVWCIKLFDHETLTAVIGYEDGSMMCWNATEAKIIRKAIKMFSEPVMCFDACDCDGVLEGISGSANDELIKWKTGCNIISDDVVPNDKKNDSNSVRNIEDFEITKTIKLVNSGLSCAKIRPDRKIVVTGGWDYKIRIFSWKHLKPLAVLDYHTNTIHAITFAVNERSSEQFLFCGSGDNKITVWKIYS